MFFKIGALKNFPIFTGKQLCWLLQAFWHRTPRMTVLDISSSKYFFQLNLVFIADGRTGFCSELHWKHELNLRSSHGSSSIKGSSYKFSAFHRKTPVLKSLFNRVAGLSACSFIKKRLQNRCFSVEFTKFLRTPKWKSANDCSETCSFNWTALFNNVTFRGSLPMLFCKKLLIGISQYSQESIKKGTTAHVFSCEFC